MKFVFLLLLSACIVPGCNEPEATPTSQDVALKEVSSDSQNVFFDLGAAVGAICGIKRALGEEADVTECLARRKKEEFGKIGIKIK